MKTSLEKVKDIIKLNLDDINSQIRELSAQRETYNHMLSVIDQEIAVMAEEVPF